MNGAAGLGSCRRLPLGPQATAMHVPKRMQNVPASMAGVMRFLLTTLHESSSLIGGQAGGKRDGREPSGTGLPVEDEVRDELERLQWGADGRRRKCE